MHPPSPHTRRSPRSFSSPSRTSSKSHFIPALKSPSVLATIALYLDWPDLLSLLNTCRDSRNTFLDRNLRDTLLSRFLPGYADALRLRDFTNYHDIPVSIHDLDLLCMFSFSL